MSVSTTDAARLLSSRRKALAGGEQHGTWSPLEPNVTSPEALKELLEIDAALARIADGTYGTCEVCGGAIGRDRLRALPEIRRCVSCSD